MAEGVVIRRHAIDRGHRAQRAGIVIGAPVAHHADGADRQDRHEGLPDLVVEPVLADLVDIDRIRLAQDREFLAGDLAGAADRQARAREGVTADELRRQAKLATKGADLVLEEFTQRLDQLQPHLLRQTAHIVVRLDRHRGTARERDAFDHVGIERALGQELGALDLVRVVLEHVDEEPADRLALHFRVRHALERAEEERALIGRDQPHVVVVAEHGDHFLGLALAQQAVVDEDAGQVVADRLVDQHRRDRAVDAAREAADHLLVADLFADLGDRLFAIARHRPVAGEARKPHEVLVELRALRGVVHLGVELHGVEVTRRIGGDREGGAGRGAIDLEARGDAADVVAVAHPDLLAPVLEPALEQRQRARGRSDIGAAELGGAMAGFDEAAELLHHHLLAVADPEDRHAEGEGRFRRTRRALAGDAVRATREDDCLGGETLQEGIGDLLIGMDFAIDVELAQAARNQLRDLGAEVDDEEALMLGHVRGIGGDFAKSKSAGAPPPHPRGICGKMKGGGGPGTWARAVKRGPKAPFVISREAGRAG
ncbi:hypothetical protein SDC9_19487 [bioreactor metagenome]|uniref:Uncharacterized protein n=1 Tax=bioreactor metagenome TaxID=1076179 RepID=A0A644U438_9ZZZZ